MTVKEFEKKFAELTKKHDELEKSLTSLMTVQILMKYLTSSVSFSTKWLIQSTK